MKKDGNVWNRDETGSKVNGLLGRQIQIYGWVNWVQGLDLNLNEIKLLSNKLWSVRPIKLSHVIYGTRTWETLCVKGKNWDILHELISTLSIKFLPSANLQLNLNCLTSRKSFHFFQLFAGSRVRVQLVHMGPGSTKVTQFPLWSWNVLFTKFILSSSKIVSNSTVFYFICLVFIIIILCHRFNSSFHLIRLTLTILGVL